MVEGDGGDDTHERIFNDVRSVQSASHPRFDHRNIHLVAGKIGKCNRCENFKGCCFKVMGCVELEDFCFKGEEVVFGDGQLVDCYTIPAIDEMRREELAGSNAGRDEGVGQVGADGTFTVCPGDVYTFNGVLGVSKDLEETSYSFEGE